MAAIHERTCSSFAISIGTGLALETLFTPTAPVYDPQRVAPPKADPTKYTEAWINVFTLFRNIIGAVQGTDALLKVTHQDVIDAMLQEMDVIDSLFAIEGGGVCAPVYYACNYKTLYTSYVQKGVRVRNDSTKLQQMNTAVFNKVVNYLLKHGLFEFDMGPEPVDKNHSGRKVVLTHVPLDLIAADKMGPIDLLESHTGKIKAKHEWYSKYYQVPGADMRRLPFIRKLLFVFGDKVLIQPNEIKLRRQILDVAEECHWTPMTTKEKVMYDLDRKIMDPFLVQFLHRI